MITPEQQALVDAVRGLLDRRADSAAVRAADGFDEPLWRTLAEQIGVAALPVPEEYGGAGAGLVEAALVLEEVGRSLAPVPLLPSLVAAATTDDPDLLARIAAGEVAAVVLDPAEPVLYGAEATILLALTDAGVVLVEDAEVAPAPALDPTLRLATVAFDPASARRIVGDRTRARKAALVGVSALAAGCARRGLDMTVAYAKERQQFGRPIGSFQALKHRMADLLVLVETTRSAARAAAAGEIEPAVAAAYAKRAVGRVAAETIQLHGGIAITWEHDAHLVFKRAHALGQLLGPAHGLRAAAFAGRPAQSSRRYTER
jgi:alkylation response protein AidB-like acyl-CoA dehydrogenase